MELSSEIKNIIQGEVSSDAGVLNEFSRDASLFEIQPKLVVFPKNSADIQNLVKFVAQNKARYPELSLTPRCAGTDMSGGPLNDSIILSLTGHFNRILSAGLDSATVQPGVYYRDFEKQTLKHGLLLPCYPASREICTLGGMVANNSGGEKTLAYGKTENYVLSLKMVLRDGQEYEFRPLNHDELDAKMRQANTEGEIYRKIFELINNNYKELLAAKPKVSKNSAGYFLWNVWDKQNGIFDLTKLIVGSQGTLGIITEIKFKLIRPKPARSMLLIFLKNLAALGEIIRRVLKYQPESFESYDDQTFRVALKFFPEFAGQLKGNLLKLTWQFLPEIWMLASGGAPKLVLMAEFAADSQRQAQSQAFLARESLKDLNLKTKLAKTAGEAQKYWTVRRESFNLLRHKIRDKHTAPFIDDFAVRPEQLPEFLPKLYAILSRYDILYTIAGHVGDANFHIIPLMDLSRPKAALIIEKLAREVYSLVFQYRGTTTGEHNDGLIRSPYLEEMYGVRIYRLFEATKKLFDPQNIFNPRKKTGASLAYALEHIHD